ncbi:MAG: DUF167 domain-containing protein [Deltaproteobacteria bacterium]|nr:DUF167 domain-containing protein [Deltaproteobacteria bacterium]
MAARVCPSTAKSKSSPQGVSVKDGVVVVRVSAPLEDRKANARVVKVVAAHLSVARSRVSLVRGEVARHKELFVAGLSAAAVDEALAKG